MKNENSKLAYILAIIFGVFLIGTVITIILDGDWDKIFMPVLTIVTIFVPFIITYIANKKNIILPISFQPFTLIFIFLAQYFGEMNDFYHSIWWWDKMLHILSGSYFVIIGVHLIQGTISKHKGVTNSRYIFFIALWAFSFSITMGAIWEIFEFLGDYFFTTNMVKGGLEDTITDLIVKGVASISSAIIYYFRNSKNQESN